jgi:hypothetical protein
VQRNNLHTLHEIKEKNEAAVIRITPDTLGIAAANFQCQIQMMLDADASYMEHVFH